jgi:3-hydroxyisobutyrate dehydrogenase
MTGKIAVIGLGSMGLGMAQSLLRAGFEVAGCDLSQTARDNLIQAGGTAHDSPAAAAQGCDIALSVVVNAAQTEAVLFGESGVAGALPKGGLFISAATMMPAIARDLAGRAEALGLHYLDAPISGGAKKAASGDLSIMASGSAQAFDLAAGALAAIAAKVHRLGDAPGVGASVKMINQLLAGVHIAAACEAMTLAAKMELDLDAVYQVIKGSAGNSWMFENRVPHILEGDYTPLSAVEIFVKDLGIVQDIARQERFPAPIAAAALQMYLATSGAGMGGDDDASLARLYAQLSGTKLPENDGDPS